MKKIIVSVLSLFLVSVAGAQTSGIDVLKDLEGNQLSGQEIRLTAITKAATRLFEAKNDLTTVIMLIPKGSEVSVIGSDSTYFHVVFEEYDGYIFRRHAILNEPEEISKPPVQKVEPVNDTQLQVQQEQQVSRFSYLEEKYGTSMASRMIAGKIWKGMTAEMVRDSWGSPQRINRVISGNVVKEEWIFKNSWLYLENDYLVEWGPIKK